MFGPTSLEKTDCNLEGVRVIETDVDCRPCYERVCPIDHRCMTRLEPARVSDELRDFLDAGSLDSRSGEVVDRGRREGQNAGTSRAP
jgi:heptosyltransferase-2